MTNKTPDSQTSRLPRPQRREFPAPLTGPLSSDAGDAGDASPVTTAAPEPHYDEYDQYDDYEPARESLLRNPYVLAALAVAGAIFMAIVVVAMAGSGGGGGSSAAMTTPDPLTPQPGGVTIDTISTATVRQGPGTDYDDLGTLPRGQKVSVTGRDADGKWFQIVFPQNSTLRGWVPASALKVADLSISGLAVVSVTPLSRPTPIPPTQPPAPTEVPTATATVTATAAPGPDLAVSMNCTAGATVVVTVRNAGAVPVNGRAATVSISIGGQVRTTNQVQLNFEPESSVTFQSDQVITAPSTSVQLTLLGSPADTDASDNTAQCALQGGATPSPAATTTGAVVPTRTPTVQTVSP